MAERFVTIKQAAAMLRVSEATLRRWDASGALHARRHPGNGYRMYAVADLDAHARAMRPQAATTRTVRAVEAEDAALIGRAGDVAALQKALGRSGARLLTLVGPPGVGKSVLAAFVARAVDRETLVCDLASVATSGAAVETVVAEALGLGGDARAQIGQALAQRGTGVLLLDNVDRVIEPVATAAVQWLREAPSLRVIVTSREALGLRDEGRYEVGPLADDAARQLFAARASRALPGFSATDEDHAAIGALVARLDRLPLAIELAAARVAMMTPAMLLARWSDDVLSRGARDAPSHHRTLRAAVAWSCALLDPAERSALTQCAVFVDGFALEDAEAVVRLDAGVRVLDALQALQERSLLRRLDGPAPRFALYTSVAEYARAEAPARDASARHTAHLLARAERWACAMNGPDASDALAAALRDAGNVTAAIARATADAPIVAVRLALAFDRVVGETRPAEGRLAMLDDALRSANRAADPRWIARVHRARADARRAAGRLDEADEDAATAARLAHAHGETACEADANALRARLRMLSGAWREADALVARALVGYRRVDDHAGRARALALRGVIASSRGRPASARACLREALSLARTARDRRAEAATLDHLAFVESSAGRASVARSCLEQALVLHRETGERHAEGTTALNLARTSLGDSQWADAERHALEARAIHRTLGAARMEVLDEVVLASARFALGRLDESLDATRRALDRAGRAGPHARILAQLSFAAHAAFGAHAHEAELALSEARAVIEQARDASARAAARATEGFVALGAAMRASDAREARQQLALARERAQEPAHGGEAHGSDPWLVRHLLRAALVQHGRAAPETPAGRRVASDLVVAMHGRAFRVRGDARVSLARHAALARLLDALTREHATHPGRALDTAALFAAGWPDQRARPDAAANRVWSAVAALRRLGLRALLHRDDAGYRLDPDATVTRGRA